MSSGRWDETKKHRQQKRFKTPSSGTSETTNRNHLVERPLISQVSREDKQDPSRNVFPHDRQGDDEPRKQSFGVLVILGLLPGRGYLGGRSG